MISRFKLFLSFLLLPLFYISLFAQQEEEPLYKDFASRFQTKSFSVGFLSQNIADFQSTRISGKSGFTVPNLRLKLTGEFDGGFGYHIQTNFISTPTILFGFGYWKIDPSFNVEFGLMKTPFGREYYLVAAQNTDFIYRSQVINALSMRRQIGVHVKGVVLDSHFSYGLGIYNGNSFSDKGNDNNDFMVSSRIAFLTSLSENKKDKFEIGLSAASSSDSARIKVLNKNEIGPIKKLYYGADIKFVFSDFLVTGEFIGIDMKANSGVKANPTGFYLTLGYMLNAKMQGLIKWDNLRSMKLTSISDSDQLIFGYTYWVTTPFKVQVNYVVPFPQKELKFHQLLVNAQIAI